MTTRPFALRARWVIPVAGDPIDGGVVSIADGRIAAVGSAAASHVAARDIVDLGDVAILPGLVNAHTHLEFSDLAAPLGRRGMGICDWIPLVVADRRRSGRDADAAVRAGIAESARYGVTAIGEIAQRDGSPAAVASLPLAVNVYQELIGLACDRVDELCAAAREHAARTPPPPARWRTAASPHAPYSVSLDVVRRLADLPLAMHVAESREEVELLAVASGPMRAMLENFGIWREGYFGRGGVLQRPVDVLRALAGDPKKPVTNATALVVHGNYLDAAAMDFLAAAPRPMVVVYCPRTHAYFGHEPYPLVELLRRNIPVALGTDSRASNPDLSILAELRHVALHFPDLPSKQVLAMATINGASALMRSDECGSIEVGKSADLAVVELNATQRSANSDADSHNDPIRQLFHSDGDVLATIAAGQVVYDPRGLIRSAVIG